MIEIKTSNSAESLIKGGEIDMSKSILICSVCDKKSAQGIIKHFEGRQEAEDFFGSKSMGDLFSIAKNEGDPHIFMVGLSSKYDYIDLTQIIKHYPFAFICPADLYVGDAFQDARRDGAVTSYATYILGQIKHLPDTRLVLTDNHASLYEDMDAFLSDMKAVDVAIRSTFNVTIDTSKLIFVLNHIEEMTTPNIVLASALAKSRPGYYPDISPLYSVVPRLDRWDVGDMKAAYFMKHVDGSVTVRNLTNMLEVGDPRKAVTVDRVVSYIKERMDLEKFKGRRLRRSQSLAVEKEIHDILSPLVGDMIYDYRINRVEIIQRGIGYVDIECDIAIRPRLCAEFVSISIREEGI